MAFFPREGEWTYTYRRKKESTVFTPNTFVTEDVDASEVIPAVAGSTALYGICLEEVTATSDNYATNDRILIAVPKNRGSKFYGDIGTGTIAIGDEGNLIDLKNSAEADATASATDVLRIDTYISNTSALFTLNKPIVA